MLKRTVGVCVCFVVFGVGATQGYAFEGKERSVQGYVEEVAPDESYVILEGEKILLRAGLLDECYLEEGEETILAVEDTVDGPMAVKCDFPSVDIYEEVEYLPDASSFSWEGAGRFFLQLLQLPLPAP